MQADITEIIMKRKREESSQTEKAFDTSRAFTSFEEIVKIFLMVCISFQISRHVASLIWGLMTNEKQKKAKWRKTSYG